jgi:hypothetical protein
MTTQPHGHRDVIEAALTDWWTTTDPTQPFHAPAIAEQIETYLLSSGYTIAPDIRKTLMPSRYAIAFSVCLALTCLGATITSATHGNWGWASIALTATGAFTVELLNDLTERRHAQNHR